MTGQELYHWINARAPFDTQMDFDNSGFLVGDPDGKITGVLFALDVTEAVLDEADQLACNLIVTHHPIMFHPTQRVTSDTPEGRIIMRMCQRQQSLIAAHTNLDRAPGGINDVLAEKCGLESFEGSDFVRFGCLKEARPLHVLVKEISESLQTTVRVMGQAHETQLVRRIAVSSGAGSDMWEEVSAWHPEVFVSGEIRHHHALAMNAEGIVGLECGHFATEEPGLFALAAALQKDALAVESKLRIYTSKTGAYRLFS